MSAEIRFEVIIVVVFLMIIVSEYLTYISFHTAGIIKSGKIEIILMALGIIMPLAFLVSMFYGYKHYSIANSIINTTGSVWLSLVFFTFIASLAIFFLIMINHYWGTKIPVEFISKIFILLAVLTTIYSTWNSSHIEKVFYSVNSSKLTNTWQNKKIILISDLHIGNLRGENFIKRVVSMINSENPDFLFISGDLIEGSSFPYKKWLSNLESINPKIKIFYVEGNHEKYNLEYDLFREGIPGNIINITDKKIITEGAQLIGLHHEEKENSEETLARLNNLGYEKNKPSIILIHDPKNTDILLKENSSLVLSGHTHKGQFFPFTWLIEYMYKKYAYGINVVDDSVSIISSGIGTSMIPLRLGTKSEMVIINIK